MRAWWLVCVAACGRIGFDPGAGAVPGDGSIDALPIDAAPCGAVAQQLPIDTGATPEGDWVSKFRATPIDQGFAVSYIAPDGVAFALTFSTTAGTLPIKADTQIVPMASSIQPLGTGPGLLLEPISSSSSTLAPYTKMLTVNGGGVTRPSRSPVTRALASSNHVFAYADTGATAAVEIRPVSAAGADLKAPSPTVDMAEMASDVWLSEAGPGFIMTWIDHSRNPTVVRAKVLDSALQNATSPLDIGNTGASQTHPSAALAVAAGRMLFAWNQVQGSTIEVWVQLTDGSLAPIGPPQMVGTGGEPKVMTDGASFWVIWGNGAGILVGAHVTTDHQVLPFTVSGTNGMATDFDVVTLDAGPALMWFERGGTGHPLWLVPACTLQGGGA